MAAILQVTVSNTFSSIKIFEDRIAICNWLKLGSKCPVKKLSVSYPSLYLINSLRQSDTYTRH